jgi:hypothetical protein
VFGLEKNGSETLQLIHQAYGDDAMRRAAVFKWWKRFRSNFEVIKRSKLSSWSLRQTICSTFSRSGWSVVRSASLAKGGTSKKRPSPHLHKVPTRSYKMSQRTFQTAFLHINCFKLRLITNHFMTYKLNRNKVT